MSKLYLIEGPVGAGKSTYARELAQRTRGVHFSLDAWFATLFSPDRPEGGFSPSWYGNRKQRLLEALWQQGRGIAAAGIDVILELGLIQRIPRRAFCERFQAEGIALAVHVLDAPVDVRRARVRRRNAERSGTFAMVVTDEMFELANRLWEPPDDLECEAWPVEFIQGHGRPARQPRR